MNFKINKRDYFIIIFIIIFFIFGFIFGKYNFFENKNNNNLDNNINTFTKDFNNLFKNDKKIDYKLFNEAFSIISENYYSSNNINSKDVVYGMINGVVESLNDKYSNFFNIEETKNFNEALSGDFEGIGAFVEKNDFGVLIDRLIAGSPAKKAGILSGDIVIKADGIDLKDLTITEAVSKIKGKAGTKVILEIIRPGERENIIKEVIRQKITIPSVDGKIINDNIGYIVLSIYGEKSGEEFLNKLNELREKNIKGLILDLRDNGGGFLETAVQILSNFVEEDKLLVTTKEKDFLNNKSYFSRGSENKFNLPLVILINGNSASASEITAGALKDYNLGILVGENSYGKGSVQKPFMLSDGSELKLTVAKWFTPLDNGIDGIGIKPDFEVKFLKEDYENNYDRQLEKAKEILNKFIELNGNIKQTKEFFIKEKQTQLREKLDNLTSSGITNTGSNN